MKATLTLLFFFALFSFSAVAQGSDYLVTNNGVTSSYQTGVWKMASKEALARFRDEAVMKIAMLEAEIDRLREQLAETKEGKTKEE